MSGLYSNHANPGDIIHRGLPPIDGDPTLHFRTGGPPSKIRFHGTGKDHRLGYVAEFTIEDKLSRVPLSRLKSALIKALAVSEVENDEVPVTGGKPRQDSVKLKFNDISYALSCVRKSLPRHCYDHQPPSGMD